jgi:ribonuclease BN (tRNA processing enzyme)
MAEEKLDWPNLDAIWVSHFHLDHFGGLAPFLFSMKWAPQTQARTKTLRIAGPEGLRNLLYSINDANNYRLFSQPFNIEVFEIKPSAQFEILPGVAATTMKTPHTKESLALHLKDLDNKTFVYAGDTGYVEELAAFARNVNLLLMECSFRRNKPLRTHLELAEATRLGQTSNPEMLVLTHLYPEWDGIDVVSEANSLCSCKIVEARDGLEIKV